VKWRRRQVRPINTKQGDVCRRVAASERRLDGVAAREGDGDPPSSANASSAGDDKAGPPYEPARSRALGMNGNDARCGSRHHARECGRQVLQRTK
jgi:hypothetical protein